MAVRKLKDYEKHIRVKKYKAVCGADIGPFEWAFLEPDHARETVAREERLLPCPACWAAIGEKELPDD